jgi:SAM-dependent methyltransferase
MYVMESADEGARVEQKTNVSLTLAQLARLPILPHSKVLDVGCASGTVTRLIASQLSADGLVVGVDSSANRIAEARAHPDHSSRSEYRVGRAEQLPAHSCAFDVCWARFLFEYLPDPTVVMSELVRVLRDGGTLCVSDLDGNCVWHEPIDAALRYDIDEALATLGVEFDASAGRKLYGLLYKLGMERITVDIQPYHVIAGSICSKARSLWIMKLNTIQLSLEQRGWPAIRAARLCERFLVHLDDPGTLTYSTLITVTAIKPERQ